MESFIIENNDKSLIIGGDFNTVMNVNKDKKGGNSNTNKNTRTKLNEIASNNELNDIWRIFNPDNHSFTWHSNHKPPIFCRLDFFLVTADILTSTMNCKISTGFKSDHSIVYFVLDTTSANRGPGYFKLNNSILFDKEYQQQIQNCIVETLNINKDANPNTLWEVIKGNIRNETILYTTNKMKKYKNEEHKLTEEIGTLETEFATHQNEEVGNILKDKKCKLETLIENKTNGIILRAKADWIEGAERNTKYFARLEKKRQEAKTIKRLEVNNTEITEPNLILNETKAYFESIYKKINIEDNSSFFNLKSSEKLSNDQKLQCEGSLTEEECFVALKEMNNNKSPGSDGLTTEFYKLFWNDIKHVFLKSINYSYQTGNLTELQKQGIISLLPKKDKNVLRLANWRPISLLNVDYKITSKVIANRMKKVLPDLINNSQTGFLKGRYIGENIRTILETIEHANETDTPGLIFFADFEKAFDSIDHSFMYKCLEHLNFGKSFISWVTLFYNDAKGCITNNGHMSDFFNIGRGVRQGCPLSPYLFICAIEILYKAINKNEDIIGLTIEQNHIKNTAFADDATFFLNGSKQSLETLIELIDKYSKVSGLKLNNNKSIILRIGSSKRNTEILCQDRKFFWTSDKATTLGITFTNNLYETIELNYQKKVNEFNNCLDKWGKYKLSLIGKIAVIKTFAIPKIIYPLTVLELPNNGIIKAIKTKMFNFLWDGKPDKIKRETIVQSYEDGGLKMIDFDIFIRTLKCSWIKRLSDPNNLGDWKKIYLNKLKKCGGLSIFNTNMNVTDAKTMVKTSTFLNEIISSWANINFQDNINNISSQVIWNNSLIRHNKKLIYYPKWKNAGIETIGQLYDYRYKLFLTFEQIKRKFNLSDSEFLTYYQILSSIPKQWKNKLKHEQIEPLSTNLYRLIIIKKNINKILTKMQVKAMHCTTDIKSQKQWDKQFHDLNWKDIYSMPHYCTIDTKLRAFQYKYNMRIYPTNQFLFKCKITSSSLCEFCNMDCETIEHLFWECQVVQAFWTGITNFIEAKQISIKVNFQTASFGTNITHAHKMSFNFIMLTAKYFIVKCKYTNVHPEIHHFINSLKQIEKIERIIAQNKGKLAIHDNKWNILL